MKKAANITITLVALFLVAIGGYYITELVKAMGANMITIQGVLGCYLTSLVLIGAIWFLIINKIN